MELTFTQEMILQIDWNTLVSRNTCFGAEAHTIPIYKIRFI